jgi:hypothetical protein
MLNPSIKTGKNNSPQRHKGIEKKQTKPKILLLTKKILFTEFQSIASKASGAD